MAAVGGLRGTGDWGTDERPKSFRESILRVRPNGTAPIFGLTAKAKKVTKNDPEFSWWAEGETLFRLQVNGSHGSTATTITVDSADPTASTLGANYGLATHLKEGDLLFCEPAADTTTFTQELIEVVQVLSTTQFVVKRGRGGTTAATIADDTYLTVIGSAYAEGTGIPRAVSRNPIKFSNYTQIFKDSYELTNTAAVTEVRTGDAWSEDKKRKAFDHAQKIEWAMMFGRKYEGSGDNGKPQRFMGGLLEAIPTANKTVFGSAVTLNSLLTALGPAFDYNSAAGDTRIAFGGNTALMELNKVIKGDAAVRINFDKKINMYGLDFTEMVLPRGRVMFYSHPLLNLHGLYKKSMFVLDFSTIAYVSLPGRDTKAKDNVQAEDEDVKRGFWQTECSLMVDAGGLTQAYLGNISAT